MSKPHIAVIMGGRSAERDVSLQTGECVQRALQSLGYPVDALDYDDGFVDALRRLHPAAAFNALHGGAGEDGTVAALLDWLRVPYQGSGVLASAVAMDKWMTKAVLAAEGLPVARGIKLTPREANEFAVARSFGLPCVLKPNAEGSAVGVSVVREAAEFSNAVRSASLDGGDILVEEYIEGREFTVAILADEPLPVVEIVPHDRFYTYQAKYTPGGSTHVVPASLAPATAHKMQLDALALHRALGCRDYSRVDIMMTQPGRIVILECNTLPGLTPLSLFPDAAKAAGISYDALVERLLVCALSRS